MKLTADQLIDMMNEMARFRLHLDRLSALERIAKETNAKDKRLQMIRVAKDACLWAPSDPSDDDLARLYALARAAVIAEGAARTADFRRKFGIEIESLELPAEFVAGQA